MEALFAHENSRNRVGLYQAQEGQTRSEAPRRCRRPRVEIQLQHGSVEAEAEDATRLESAQSTGN